MRIPVKQGRETNLTRANDPQKSQRFSPANIVLYDNKNIVLYDKKIGAKVSLKTQQAPLLSTSKSLKN